ncbi:glycerol-3-phosphate acyltransferase [Chloroflexi bacterium]|nr:glycerol-3-phosphate acyltransferase [Chloroflexota bacterium]
MYDTVVWILIGFLSGSVPWSLICVRIFSDRDVRDVGDGNPGATNAWISGGWIVGTIAIFLDVFKAVIPVWVFANYYLEPSLILYPFSVTAVAISPILGHAYSPFLSFKGGKALAPSWGSWIALTSGIAFPVALIVLGLVHLMQKNHAITVTACLVCFITLFGIIDTASLFIFGFLNLTLVIFKHRYEYRHGIVLRSWVRM